MSSIISFGKDSLRELDEELGKAIKTGNLRSYRVIQAILYIGSKDYDFSMGQIANLLNVTRRTVFNWFKKFMCGGIKWVKNDPFNFASRGRPSRLDAKQKEDLYNMVVDGPEKNGFYSGVWNCAMIAELIFVKFGVKYNPRYLCKLLKKMGLSYQKAKFIPAKCDEEDYLAARKKWQEETWPGLLEKAKKENAIILFGDEVSFAMWGSLGRTWGVRGKQPEVKTKGCRKGLKMFGAIEFQSGQFFYMESLAYSIAPASIKLFKKEGISDETLNQLKILKGEKFENKENYLNALEELIGKEAVEKDEAIWLKHTEIAGKFNGENYIKFLQKIIEESTEKVILVEDGAPYHGSHIVKDFVKEHSEKLYLERLPSFSPDFNPIEKLWKNTKRDATHCKYFETFEKLRESVVNAFEHYLCDAAQVLCVMTKLREEAKSDGFI
jgi:transposase